MRRGLRVWLLAALAASSSAAWAQTGAPDPELNKGIQLVEEGDFDTAVRTLNGVVKRLQAAGGSTRDLSRAQLYLGIAHLSLRSEASARSAFSEALRADPGLTLSADEFPPRVIAAFDQARRGARPAPPSAPPPPTTLASPPPVTAPAKPTTPTTPTTPKTSPVVFIEAVKQGDFATVRTLLTEDPAHVNEKDTRFGATALHWASLRGHQAIVALLIERGADAGLKNNDGETALVVAERAKREDVVRLLRSTGAPAAPGVSTIFEAVKAGDVPAVRRLLEESPGLVSRPDTGFGATPLHWAALRGHDDVARLLLEKGADVNARNNDGETPLQVAERGKRGGMVQLLKARGGEAGGGLVDAVKAGDLPRVQQQLTANPGALNQKDAAFGATPLHWAALRGHAEVARFLLAQGADPRATNKDGETPLRVAERAKRAEAVAVLQGSSSAAPPASKPAASAPLPPSGAPVHSPALVDAVKAGNLARVRALLDENPARVNGKDDQFGATPLHWAALRGHAEVAEYLIAQGADVNARNGAGETPLQVAQRAGRSEVVRVLSKSGS